MTHHRETVLATDAPAAVGPYVHAVKSNGFVFCSGQIALDPESMKIVGDTPAEQARKCLENLSAVAAASGATLADAVKCTVFLVDMGAFAEVNAVYEEFFGTTSPPARVAIAVAALPLGALVEVDAVLALS
jgi:2-iminobutanoate/2-iminopropanoate deaminase